MDIDYATPGVFTTVAPEQVPLTRDLPEDPVGICAAVQQLVVHPMDAPAAGVPEGRLAERNIRPASGVIDALVAQDPGAFLTGGEARQWFRTGEVDGNLFGVIGTDHAWGVGEIRGNLMRDLASLVKIETLPWDEWGRMEDSYQGRTGEDFDRLMDRIADACALDDPAALREVYAAEDLAVPAEVLH